MKNKFIKISLFLARTCLTLALLLGVLFAISLLPIKHNYRLYSVMSGSMVPEIPVGSLAIVVPSSSYQENDIITFISHGAKSDKDTTTHRIVGIVRDGGQKMYITKGDANEDPDAKPVPEKNVIGKYYFGIAAVGYLLKYIFTMPGLVALIFVPALFIIFSEIKIIIEELKNIKGRRGYGA